MLELYVRRINLELVDRSFAPMPHATHPSRRGFVNEIAFEIFSSTSASVKNEGVATEDESVAKARNLIQRLEKNQIVDLADPTADEMDDAREQVRRLRFFFHSIAHGRAIDTKPRFAGCGIIDTCEGDVYIEGELFEVKAGDRNVRSVDLRQLLVYSALNYSDEKRHIRKIGLFNPRVGTHFSTTLEEFCTEVSGRSATEMLSELVQVFSSGDISR